MDHTYFDLIFDCKLSCYPFQSGNCNRLAMGRVKCASEKAYKERWDGGGGIKPFATDA